MPKKKQPARKGGNTRRKHVAEVWVDQPMFVAFPPEHIDIAPGQPRPLPDLYTDLRDSQARYEDGLWIRTYLDLFTETNDPLALMQAFLISMELGIYPPVAILHALAGAFQTVLDGNGKKKLEVVLGLSGTGQGTWNAFTKKRKTGTQFWVASTIFSLTTGYGLSIAQAAERVNLFLESHPGLGRYTVDGLIDQYSRTWKERFHLDTIDLLRPASWTPAVRDAFLKQFPDPA
jgi:hypothetical protein